jgi:hypothetical protein
MRLHLTALLMATVAGGGGLATAQEQTVVHEDAVTGAKSTATVLQEMIVTNNALDGPFAVTDTIFHLRGALAHERDTAIGKLDLGIVLETFEHRDVEFETDRSANLTAALTREIGERFVLKTSLGYLAESTGDDLDLGAVIIGTRTFGQTFAGEIDLRGQLTPRTAMALLLSGSHEDVSDAKLDAGLGTLRLSPDVNRARAGLIVTHALPTMVLRLTGRLDVVDIPEDDAFAVGSRAVTLTTGATLPDVLGFAVDGEAGFTHVSHAFSFTDRVYPVYALTVERQLHGLSASFSLKGLIDTVDTDDPLGSHVHRAELELSRPLIERLTGSIGIFGELRDNLAIGNEEEASGIYVALAFDPTSRISFLMRVDVSEINRTVFDIRENTVSGTFGLRVSL